MNQVQTFSILVVSLAASLLVSGCKYSSVGMAGRFDPVPVWTTSAAPVQLSTSDMNAAEPAIANTPSGKLLAVWVNHAAKHQADVMIARLDQNGQMESPPVRVNTRPGTATSWRGDPPTIAVAPSGSVFVGWTGQVGSASGHHSTAIYVSTSHDEGRTFGEPVRVNDDSKTGPHGMHSLAIGKDGHIYVAWLDERNVKTTSAANMSSGHHMENNLDLFVSLSTDGGRSFAPNQQVATQVCPCWSPDHHCQSGVTTG